jgi:hypothetical protein
VSHFVASLGMYDHPAQQAANDALVGLDRGAAGGAGRCGRSRKA